MEHLTPLDNLSGRSLFHVGTEKPSRSWGMQYTKVLVVIGDERVFTESEVKALLREAETVARIMGALLLEEGEARSMAASDIATIALRHGVSLDPA